MVDSMKRIVRKWWLRALAAVMIPLTVACSVGDEDGYEAAPSFDNAVATTGIYEGEWTVNKQVVDTARLVVADNVIRIRLPEKYLVSTYRLVDVVYPYGAPGDKGDKGDIVGYELHNAPITVQVSAQGYSEQSQYMSFTSGTMQDGGLLTRFNTCSFEITLNDTPFRIGLLSREYATAVLQNATGQWTLGVPIDGFLIKNLTTGESKVHEISSTTIYYNTKRKIG